MSFQINEQNEQIALALLLAIELEELGYEEISTSDVLDAMATANCHLKLGGELASKAYQNIVMTGKKLS